MAKTKLGNVKGPQGAQGPKGDTGAQGPQGATGPTGPKGSTGQRGSQWYTGTAVTGTSTSGTAFPSSGVESALVGDIYLNTQTGNVYHCATAGNASAAKWAYVGCIRGPQGVQGAKGDTGATGPTGPQGKQGPEGPQGPQGPKGDPTTVDASLSDSSVNPVQNKVVKAAIDDVRDSLSQVPAMHSGTAKVEGTFSNGLFVADIEFGVNLGTTEYQLIITLERNGVQAFASVRNKSATGATIYVGTTGSYAKESFTVHWLAIVE